MTTATGPADEESKDGKLVFADEASWQVWITLYPKGFKASEKEVAIVWLLPQRAIGTGVGRDICVEKKGFENPAFRAVVMGLETKADFERLDNRR